MNEYKLSKRTDDIMHRMIALTIGIIGPTG